MILLMDNNYTVMLEWLNQRSSEAVFFRKKAQPSLEEVNRALDRLGRPDQFFKYRVIVGGTAGKGTVCRYIEQTLIQEGLSVALLSSPHLQIVNERIRLNGQLISQTDFTETLAALKNLIETENLNLTYYEILVVAGILMARKKEIQILICEVGLGGEFDAVNAVQGVRLCALTFIGDDHREILGPKLENIAETKAKIFTRESLFNASYEQKFRSILEKNSSTELLFIKGIKQKLNKKLARKICEQIIDSKDFTIPAIQLPCRWEKVAPKIRLDGAHSAPRFEYLIETKLRKNKGPYTLILGAQKRHNSDDLKLIFRYAKNIIWTESGQTDCHSAATLKTIHNTGEAIKNPYEALKKAQTYDEPILVTGSLYLCGKIREHFYPNHQLLETQNEWPT